MLFVNYQKRRIEKAKGGSCYAWYLKQSPRSEMTTKLVRSMTFRGLHKSVPLHLIGLRDSREDCVVKITASTPNFDIVVVAIE